jgi:pyruvate kinase
VGMGNDLGFKLAEDDEIILTCDQRYKKCSTNEVCFLSNFQRFIEKLKPGDEIKIGPKIVVEVVKVAMNSYVTCRVLQPGTLKSHQKVEIPSIPDDSLELSQEEVEDLTLAVKLKFDFVVVPNVDLPQRYHKLRKLTKGSDLKIIAGIDPRAKQKTAEKIVKHFHGIFIESSPIDDFIITTARQLGKLIVADFPSGNSFGSFAMKICLHADSLILKPSSVVDEAAKNLINIMKNSIETENEALKVPPATKAIVCMTQKEETARRIAAFHLNSPIILLTKSEEIVKNLQIWRNIHAIFYIDSEKKPWPQQREEMMKIALMYGKDLKILQPTDQVAACFSGSDNVESFQVQSISELFK